MTTPADARISEIDPQDAEALVAWNDVMRAAYDEGREAFFWRSASAVVGQFSAPPREGVRRVALAAHVDGTLVGGADASVTEGEPGEIEIGVLPAWRRRGLGRALFDAAAAVLGAETTVQLEISCDAGIAFAQAMGLAVVHDEGRLVADLPMDPARLDDLEARHPRSPGVEVVSWVGAAPEEHIEAWVALTRQMDEDVPGGGLTRHTRFGDVEAVRRNERRMDEQGYDLVRTLALADGAPAGYTEIFVDRANPTVVLQDDTLVDRAHRGRGLGWTLKFANLRQLATVPSAAASRWIQTWNAHDNAAVLRMNEQLGYRQADVLTMVEGVVRPGEASRTD